MSNCPLGLNPAKAIAKVFINIIIYLFLIVLL